MATLISICKAAADDDQRPLRYRFDATKVYDQEVRGVELTHTECEDFWFTTLDLNISPDELRSIYAASHIAGKYFHAVATVSFFCPGMVTLSDDDETLTMGARVDVHPDWIVITFSSYDDDNGEFFQLIIQFDAELPHE